MLALRARSPCLFARGRCPLCTPFVGAQLPRLQSGGRSAPPTPGDFPVAGKVTKGAPRAAPFGIPRCVVAALFALAYASRRATFRHNKRPICHFEMVGKSVLFFPLVLSKKHSLFSIRGSAGALASRMLEGLSYRNQYRYGRKWGNPRGSAPLCRRSRNQEVPGVSLPTFSTRESRPGLGAERPKRWVQGLPVPQKPPGWRGGSPTHGEECRGRGAAPPSAQKLLP